MTQARLESVLRSMVRRYGFEQVNESLQEIGNSESYSVKSNHKAMPTTKLADTQANKRNLRITAPQYVAKMDIPSEKGRQSLSLPGDLITSLFYPQRETSPISAISTG